MEKHQAFARALARKNKRSGDTTLPSSNTIAHSINVALKIHDLSDDPKPVVPAPVTKTKGKRKQPYEKTPSPSKKRRNLGLLLSGPPDPNVHVSDCPQFNLSPKEREPFKTMTPTEYLDMAYELLARASICLNYSVRTTKPLLVSELENANKSLATAKKEISILTERLEKANKLAEDDRVKAAATLLESKNEVKRLQ